MKLQIQKKKIRKQAAFLLSVLTILFLNVPVYATEKAEVLQSITEDNIYLYLKGIEEYGGVTGQIGRESVEIVSTKKNIYGHTIIMLDDSLSVTKDNMVKIKEILGEYIKRKPLEEKISLATFGTDIQYLVERETDVNKITEALNGIVNADKDTYLTDVLYDELQKLEMKTEYTKFIIVTDGVDNKAIGYTKEELSDYLKNHKYPIYAIGCKYKNNEEQLKNLFALSRLTQGDCYLLDDYNEFTEILDGLRETVTCVEMKVPEELKDGSVKNLLLTFTTENGEVEVAEEVGMPFALREKTESEQTEEIEEAKENLPKEIIAVTESLKEPVEELPKKEVENSIDIVSVAAGVTAAVIAVLLLANSKKKRKNQTEKKSSVKRKEGQIEISEVDSNTVIAEKIPEPDEGATLFLNSRGTNDIVVLRENDDDGRVFRYPLVNKVVIGRKYEGGVNVVLNYEPTISAKHCEISKQGGKYYIKDLNSVNGTFINERRVKEMEEVTGMNVRMGNLSMIIEFEQV